MNINFRAWLRRQPKPALLKAELADGSEKEVAIGLAKSWARDCELQCKNAIRVSALNEKNQELRIWECPNIEEFEEAQEKASEDPLANSVERIAKIMSDACDRAVERHATIVRTGFEQMGQLVQVLSARNAALEKAWQQLFFSQQQPAEEGDPNHAMVQTLMTLALGGGIGGVPKPAASNGAKVE